MPPTKFCSASGAPVWTFPLNPVGRGRKRRIDQSSIYPSLLTCPGPASEQLKNCGPTGLSPIAATIASQTRLFLHTQWPVHVVFNEGSQFCACSCLRAPVVSSVLAGVVDASEAAAAEQ